MREAQPVLGSQPPKSSAASPALLDQSHNTGTVAEATAPCRELDIPADAEHHDNEADSTTAPGVRTPILPSQSTAANVDAAVADAMAFCCELDRKSFCIDAAIP